MLINSEKTHALGNYMIWNGSFLFSLSGNRLSGISLLIISIYTFRYEITQSSESIFRARSTKYLLGEYFIVSCCIFLRMCEEQTTKVNPLNSCSYLADFLRLQPWIYWQQWVWLNVVCEWFSEEAEMQVKFFKVHMQPNNLYYIGLRCKYSEKYVLLCSWFHGSNSFTSWENWLNDGNERIVLAMNYPQG